MKKRNLIAVAALLVSALMAAGGIVLAQQSPGTLQIPSPQVTNPKLPPLPAATAPQVAQPVPTQIKPDDMTVDQLLEAVEKFREQKAEIERKEAEFMTALRKKVETQKARIDKLEGVPLPAVPFPAPGLPGAPPNPVRP